jgi:hypothetical protein
MMLPRSALVPVESRRLLMACLLAMGASRVADHLLWGEVLVTFINGLQLLRVAAILLVFLLVASGAIWSHPLRKDLLALHARLAR